MDIQHIIEDAENNKYAGRAGPLLDVIRMLLGENKISDVAVAINVFTKALPETKQFIISRLPGVILNSYIIYNVNVTIETLMLYTQEVPSWTDEIIKNACKPTELAQAVSNLLVNINAHNHT